MGCCHPLAVTPALWLLLSLLAVTPASSRPSDPTGDLAQLSAAASVSSLPQQPGLVGGSSTFSISSSSSISSNSNSYSSSSSLGSLLSNMYSSILRSRLEQLLEGVTVGEAVSSGQEVVVGVVDSEQEVLGVVGQQPSERTVTVHLPHPVTEIPRHLFSSLPGM
jgi:hypothetical protein